MAKLGMLIDYNYCTGCMTCQVACQMEKGLGDEENGILLHQTGPFPVGDKWEFDFVPVPTDFCDLCADRREAGKEASCVQHCQAGCMKIGPVDELAAGIETTKQVIFALA